ncbi:MAG: hydroxylamine reductase [Spirochaetes bacterium]|jgi:hydroxylamine reductase|nr:hydroxylamine reductase [Spirochaetota bacterium]
MSMFCFQCQETAKNSGCTIHGACGKKGPTANLQDLLISHLKGICELLTSSPASQPYDEKYGRFITESLFMTITNANFDDNAIIAKISEAILLKQELVKKFSLDVSKTSPLASWSEPAVTGENRIPEGCGVNAIEDENIRSLTELITYGVKGISAYLHHAAVLDYEDKDIYDFIINTLSQIVKNNSVDDLIALTLATGEHAVKTMALLDKGNTETFGNPEITKVQIGTRSAPGILISGHDLLDLKELLEQTEGSGVDVYTHSEMLPAHYYPELKKFKHLVGNYGNAWWKQGEEFDSFNGAILMTTNCITPVKDSYKDRIFTTGMAGYTDIPHIPDRKPGEQKDFSEVIARAKECPAPLQIEKGEITGGFAHNQVLALADKVVEAVKSGQIKKFVVMAGCDGRHKTRNYFTDVAQKLPDDTIILTAGCAKYRYNKLDLGDIGGIPRVLDAGQCNDSYSLALIALKLRDVFELDDINDLPIDFDIAWYEQKAVAVLLALLALGFKGIRIGPTLPAFLSPAVVDLLIQNFDLKLITDADSDVEAITA